MALGFDPYGGAMDTYTAPGRARRAQVPGYSPFSSEGMNPVGAPFTGSAPQPARPAQPIAPMAGGGQQTYAPQQPQMSPDHLLRRQNMGLDSRGPSPGSTLGRVAHFAADPVQGAALARMSQVPGSQQAWAAPFADILGAGMAPALQGNQLGAEAVRGAGIQNNTAQATAQYAPQIAQQAVRGATIQNNNNAAQGPANVARTNAEAGAITAGQGQTPQTVNQLQAQLRQHQAENQQLRSQLEKYQAGEQRAANTSATDARANQHEQNVNQREQQRISEGARTRDMNRGAAMAGKIMEAVPSTKAPDAMNQAYDALGLRGSPTTQPTTSAPAGAAAAGQGAVARQPGDQVYLNHVYRQGKDGQFYKVGPAGQ